SVAVCLGLGGASARTGNERLAEDGEAPFRRICMSACIVFGCSARRPVDRLELLRAASGREWPRHVAGLIAGEEEGDRLCQRALRQACTQPGATSETAWIREVHALAVSLDVLQHHAEAEGVLLHGAPARVLRHQLVAGVGNAQACAATLHLQRVDRDLHGRGWLWYRAQDEALWRIELLDHLGVLLGACCLIGHEQPAAHLQCREAPPCPRREPRLELRRV